MAVTPIVAQRHVPQRAPYVSVTFAEQNKALVGKSARLRGFEFVSITPLTSITIAPGYFISTGLALNPTFPNRTSGLIAETTANAVLDVSDFAPATDFYIFALVQTTVDGQTVDFLTATSPSPPNGQYAPIARYIAGQYILEDALGDDGVEEQVDKARSDSGADQFYLTFEPASSPLEINLTAASQPDGTLFPATTNYAGTPNFAVPGTNYVFFNTGLGVIENNSSGFPASNALPLWEFVLNGSSQVTSLLDRRPWFGGGSGGGDAGAIEERLKEILQHSVMQNARISSLPGLVSPDVGGVSNGAFLGPSEYELDNTEILESDFSVAALEAPANIAQVTVAVIVDQLLLPGDLTIEVSRDGGTTYETVADNFTNHVFGAVPAGNNLQLRVTNASGGTLVVRGYGMYYNNIGGPTGVLNVETGLVQDTSGLNFYNTNINAAHFAASDFGFTWDAVTAGGTLSWGSVVAGTPDDLRIEVTDPLNETVVNTLVAPGSLTGIAAGDYVYFDINRAGGPIALVVSPGGPPAMQQDRHIFGRRIPEPNGGNDEFIIYDDFKILDVNDNPTALDQPFPPPLLPITTIQSILAGNSVIGTPTIINAIAAGAPGPTGDIDTVYNIPAGATNIWIFSQLSNGDSPNVNYGSPSVFMGVYDVAAVVIRGVRSDEGVGAGFRGRVVPVLTSAALVAPGVDLNRITTNVSGFTSLHSGTTSSFVVRQNWQVVNNSSGHVTFLVAT